MRSRIRWRRDTLIEQVRSVCRVDPETGCWIWTRAVFAQTGYGAIRFEGSTQGVHRLVHSIATGGDGQVVRHTCDNPPCCNPEHLLWGTHARNVQDAMDRGRVRSGPSHPFYRNPTRVEGARWPTQKLLQADVDEIRRLRAEESLTYAELGRRFSVHRDHIRNIITGRSWAQVSA